MGRRADGDITFCHKLLLEIYEIIGQIVVIQSRSNLILAYLCNNCQLGNIAEWIKLGSRLLLKAAFTLDTCLSWAAFTSSLGLVLLRLTTEQVSMWLACQARPC